jgi:hypothetical protein
MSRRLACIAVLCAAAALVPAAVVADGNHERELSVLFIGNSFTQFHQLERLVRRLAENDPGAPRIHTHTETRPGCTLRRHWIGRRAVTEIRRGGYTHVVLQDHSLRPLDRPEEMVAYARRFDEEIERAGARTVLYSTWARRPGSGFYRTRPGLDAHSMQERVDHVYVDLAQELDAELAPVGGAFLEAQSSLPEVPLRGRDGFHPTLAGSYLAACVLFRALTGRSPEGNPYVPWGLEPDIAHGLSQLAASDGANE